MPHEAKMKIKITKHTVVNCKAVKPDVVVEVSDIDGRMLIGMKRAIEFIPVKKKAKRKARTHV